MLLEGGESSFSMSSCACNRMTEASRAVCLVVRVWRTVDSQHVGLGVIGFAQTLTLGSLQVGKKLLEAPAEMVGCTGLRLDTHFPVGMAVAVR